eukprot:CAMPEP_0201550338 /NCGR_PEP_ID=MMETSP0173_2-20130828/6723_1 /ASSEMBLY_ACC=CAM_ASM_000268 /TAXON_ID=218659 /ORGANISM="Vexillifera sp., Strain DIVA3 564/2" /LENGTH=99 /DNA_ID=CAMNT_0047960283 /DNA_START=107 /DNA_END=403 /DNA_ORIENTATION=+
MQDDNKTLEKLDFSQQPSIFLIDEQTKNDDRKTYFVPQSSILSKLESFLPELASSNQKLQTDIEKHGRDAFDIEVLDKQLPTSNNTSMITSSSSSSSDD